jgi:hypothetical protein
MMIEDMGTTTQSSLLIFIQKRLVSFLYSLFCLQRTDKLLRKRTREQVPLVASRSP